MPRNPPSLAASATCWLICRSHPLNAAASSRALGRPAPPTWRSVSRHLALISAGLLPANLFLEAVARQASSFGGFEISDDSLDQGVRRGVRLTGGQSRTGREALLEQAPEPARLGGGDCDTCHHHAFENELPFVGGEARFVRHWGDPPPASVDPSIVRTQREGRVDLRVNGRRQPTSSHQRPISRSIASKGSIRTGSMPLNVFATSQ